MKRKILKITLSVSALLILAVVYFQTFASPAYTYESSDRGMAEIEVPWKGRTLELVEAQFSEYKYWKNNSDLKLYRTCNRIWSAPNLWWDNLTNRRWSLPYMEPSSQPRDEYFAQMRKDLQEEYNIYHTLIEEEYLSMRGHIDLMKDFHSKEILPKTLIIENETISSETMSMKVLIKENNAQKKLIESWGKINKKKSALRDSFSFSTEHLLISPEKLKEAFLPSRWDSFYKYYPKALGIFKLSRVAFDDNKTTALVYIVNAQDATWGSGIFYFLSKDGQKWEIIKEYQDWIS